ncbi:hypothetical protein TNCV_435751 [Trichonephila clavipes]|nr:hypothetical protein TNCV_435751 [Trichonephila clavipes]
MRKFTSEIHVQKNVKARQIYLKQLYKNLPIIEIQNSCVKFRNFYNGLQCCPSRCGRFWSVSEITLYFLGCSFCKPLCFGILHPVLHNFGA